MELNNTLGTDPESGIDFFIKDIQSDIQSEFSQSRIIWIFLNMIFIQECIEIFDNFNFWHTFYINYVTKYWFFFKAINKEIIAILVVNRIASLSFWKVFIKFHWPSKHLHTMVKHGNFQSWIKVWEKSNPG